MIQSPAADIKANIEKQDVLITADSTDKNIFNIKVNALKITLSKDMGKPFLTEVSIDSEMTVRRETTEVGAPARYTVIKAALNLNNNKVRNGDPVRTLTMGLSEQFSVFLGPCPYSLGTLSLISNGVSKELVQLKEKSILNLSNQAEDALINCNETSVRPFVDLSRLLRM